MKNILLAFCFLFFYSSPSWAFKANLEYEYEDQDMNALLSLRITQEHLDVIQIAPLGPTENDLVAELRREWERNPFARTILVPLNLGNLHWVGLVIRFNTENQAEVIQYVDTQENPIPKRTREALLKLYSKDTKEKIQDLKKRIQNVPGWRQTDTTACGPLTIENMIRVAQNLLTQETADAPITEQIRIRHIDLLERYMPYLNFNYRQENNIRSFLYSGSERYFRSYLIPSDQEKLSEKDKLIIQEMIALCNRIIISCEVNPGLLTPERLELSHKRYFHLELAKTPKYWPQEFQISESYSVQKIPEEMIRTNAYDYIYLYEDLNRICELSTEVSWSIKNNPKYKMIPWKQLEFMREVFIGNIVPPGNPQTQEWLSTHWSMLQPATVDLVQDRGGGLIALLNGLKSILAEQTPSTSAILFKQLAGFYYDAFIYQDITQRLNHLCYGGNIRSLPWKLALLRTMQVSGEHFKSLAWVSRDPELTIPRKLLLDGRDVLSHIRINQLPNLVRFLEDPIEENILLSLITECREFSDRIKILSKEQNAPRTDAWNVFDLWEKLKKRNLIKKTDDYSCVSMLGATEEAPLYIDQDTLIIQEKEGFLTVYWGEAALKKINKKSFKEDEVPDEIKKYLPQLRERKKLKSEDLVKKIVSKYGCTQWPHLTGVLKAFERPVYIPAATEEKTPVVLYIEMVQDSLLPFPSCYQPITSKDEGMEVLAKKRTELKNVLERVAPIPQDSAYEIIQEQYGRFRSDIEKIIGARIDDSYHQENPGFLETIFSKLSGVRIEKAEEKQMRRIRNIKSVNRLIDVLRELFEIRYTITTEIEEGDGWSSLAKQAEGQRDIKRSTYNNPQIFTPRMTHIQVEEILKKSPLHLYAAEYLIAVICECIVKELDNYPEFNGRLSRLSVVRAFLDHLDPTYHNPLVMQSNTTYIRNYPAAIAQQVAQIAINAKFVIEETLSSVGQKGLVKGEAEKRVNKERKIGNCLFDAIAEFTEEDGEVLRNMAVEFIRNDRQLREVIRMAAERGETQDHLMVTVGDTLYDVPYKSDDQYLDVMARDQTWGTCIEIIALARRLKRPIIVFMPDGIRVPHTEPAYANNAPIELDYTGDHYVRHIALSPTQALINQTTAAIQQQLQQVQQLQYGGILNGDSIGFVSLLYQ